MKIFSVFYSIKFRRGKIKFWNTKSKSTTVSYFSRSNLQRRSVKKCFQKFRKIYMILCESFFLKNLQASKSATLLKLRLQRFLWTLRNFKSIFLIKHIQPNTSSFLDILHEILITVIKKSSKYCNIWGSEIYELVYLVF